MDIRDKILQRQLKEDSEIFRNSSLSILGCGGLGSNIAMMVARSGVGKIHIFDYDKVEYSNLNRQNYGTCQLGLKKVLASKDLIERVLPYAKVYAHDVFLNEDKMTSYLDTADIFIEAFDKKESKRFALDFFLDHPEKHLICASGLSGLGSLEDIRIKKFANITMIGDFESQTKDGLYAPYLMTIASLEALEALKLLRRYHER